MTGRETVTELVTGLRERFDAGFAEPPHPPPEDAEELLTLRAGEGRYALRLRQAAGLYSGHPVTPLPGPLPALLGVAGFSGLIVPVYDLATLLGRAAAPTSGADADRRPTARWLVLAAGSPALAVAFDALDGHVRVHAGDLVVEGTDGAAQGYLRGMVALPDGLRQIVDLPAVRAGVHALSGAENPSRNGVEHG